MVTAPATVSADPAILYLPTSEAYDRWSAVYDTDGNFLQRIDDIEMRATLLPRLLALLRGDGHGHGHGHGPVVVDLGCGTGRNTELLLSARAGEGEGGGPAIGEVVALDASRGMLDVARARLSAYLVPPSSPPPPRLSDPSSSSSSSSSPPSPPPPPSYSYSCSYPPSTEEETGAGDHGAPGREGGSRPRPRLRLALHDLLASPGDPPAGLRGGGGADAVVSTLVVEHVPLRAFFAHAAATLRPGGVLLLTNMHADMGGRSQAGFVDPATGLKTRPSSRAHTVADVVAEAARWGLTVVSEGGVEGVKEVTVSEDMVEALGARSRKWVGVTCWFGCLFRKDGGDGG